MLKNDKERKICAKYSEHDSEGFVHCDECPLLVGNPAAYDFRCKANSHYDVEQEDWVYDDNQEV